MLSTEDLGGLAPRAAYWDADPQRELVHGSRISKYKGPDLPTKLEGELVAVADVLGDWREEIDHERAGRTADLHDDDPGRDRRVTLVQDPIYRLDVVHAAMGYTQIPTPSYDLASGK